MPKACLDFTVALEKMVNWLLHDCNTCCWFALEKLFDILSSITGAWLVWPSGRAYHYRRVVYWLEHPLCSW